MDANDRSIVGLTMLGHGMVHTYELSIPVLITVWLDVFGVGTATIGLVVAAGYTLFGLGSLPGGLLADRFGSQRLIVACLLGMSVAFLAVSAAPSIGVLALALLLWGVAASVYHPSGLSLISTGVRERGTGFAYHGMAGNVGIALGPFATALLLAVLDWRAVAALLAVPAAVAAVVALRLDVRERAAVGRADGGEMAASISSPREFLAESGLLFRSSFVVVFAVVALNGLYYRGMLTFLPDLLAGFLSLDLVDEASLSTGRYLYAGILLVGVLGQYVAGKLTDRMRVERGLAGSLAGLAVIAVLFAFVVGQGLLALLVASFLLGVFLFGEQPFSQAALAKHSPVERRGLAYGYMFLGVFGIGALGAALTGFVLSYSSAPTLFLVLAAFATVAAALAGWLGR